RSHPLGERTEDLHPGGGHDNGRGMKPRNSVEEIVARKPGEDVSLGEFRKIPGISAEMRGCVACLEDERRTPIKDERGASYERKAGDVAWRFDRLVDLGGLRARASDLHVGRKVGHFNPSGSKEPDTAVK